MAGVRGRANSCAVPGWLPYLAVPGWRIDWGDLASGLYSGDGFAYRGRAKALCQLLAQVWLAPAVSRRNRAVVTEVAAPAFTVRFKVMVVGSRPQPLCEQPSDSSWRYNTALDNVADMVAFGLVVKFDNGAGPHLCVLVAGRTPSSGKSHLLCPSDARPRSRVQQKSVGRARPLVVDMTATCQRLYEDWLRVEREWGEGNESSRFELASGAPVRFILEGVGGRRFLGVPPCPISWRLWSEVIRDTVSGTGVPLEWMDVSVSASLQGCSASWMDVPLSWTSACRAFSVSASAPHLRLSRFVQGRFQDVPAHYPYIRRSQEVVPRFDACTREWYW